MIKIFLVEDHQMVIQGVKLFITSQPDMQVVGNACIPEEIFKEIPKCNPNLVLCDINLPEADGLDIASTLKERNPGLKVVILSMHKERGYVMRAIEADLDGYLNKDIQEDEFVEAIRKVNRGEKYFSKTISQTLVNNFFNKDTANTSFERLLTNREKQILKLICQGFKNREIGEKLFISAKTVSTHRANLIKKLAVKNTAELVKCAIEHKLV